MAKGHMAADRKDVTPLLVGSRGMVYPAEVLDYDYK